MKPTTQRPELLMLLARSCLLEAVVTACGPSPTAENDSNSDSGGSTTQPAGDPDAPGQGCPESFDPDAVYALIQRPASQDGVFLVADVRDPASECAFEIDLDDYGDSDSRIGTLVVRRGDGALLRAARSRPSNDFLNGNLVLEQPDPLERDNNGNWGPIVPNDEVLVEAFGSGECNFGSHDEPFTLRMHGPSGELGYDCSGAYEFRSFDGRVLEDLHDRSSASWFLSDGRAMGFGPGGPIVYPADEGADGIPIEVPPDVHDDDFGAVLEIGGVVMVAARDFSFEGTGVARLHLEDERLVIDARYAVPEIDGGPQQIVLDGDGNITVFGSRTTPAGEEHLVVVRALAGGNEVVYDELDISSGELRDMPESGGAVRVERLIFPR
jgi:hypothetical protein